MSNNIHEHLSEEQLRLISDNMEDLYSVVKSYGQKSVELKERMKSSRKACFEDVDVLTNSYNEKTPEWKLMDKSLKNASIKHNRNVLKTVANYYSLFKDDDASIEDQEKMLEKLSVMLDSLKLLFSLNSTRHEKILALLAKHGLSFDNLDETMWHNDAACLTDIVDELAGTKVSEQNHKRDVENGLNDVSEIRLVYNKDLNPCGLKSSDFTKLVNIYVEKATKDADKVSEKNTARVEDLMFSNIRNSMMSEVITNNFV